MRQMYDYVDQWTQMRFDKSNELTSEERKERIGYYETLENMGRQLRKSGDALNEAFDKPYKTSWYRNLKYWYEEDSVINEVYVDFR